MNEHLTRSLGIRQKVFPINRDPRSYNKAVNLFLTWKTVVNIQGYSHWMPTRRLPLETSCCKKMRVFIKIAKERAGGSGQSVSTTDRNRNKCHGGIEKTLFLPLQWCQHEKSKWTNNICKTVVKPNVFGRQNHCL